MSDPFWDTAREVCTEKQLRVLTLREKHGFSLRQIALACDISLSMVRDHLAAAHHNIDKALRTSA